MICSLHVAEESFFHCNASGTLVCASCSYSTHGWFEMVVKCMQEGAESTTASQDSGESSQEEGPTDVEGSQQWFKSLPPRHLPFLAVMPNAEVSISPGE